MTAHLIIENDLDENSIISLKEKIKHELEHLNIQHVTLETDRNKNFIS
jgi:cobalt-zinc-cadmium efflux system protein